MSDSDEKRLFDLGDIGDIPENLRKEISGRADKFEQNICELFDLAERPLSIDEVSVAYFRKFKEEKTRTQIMNKLYQMSKKNEPYIRVVKKGIYEKMHNSQW